MMHDIIKNRVIYYTISGVLALFSIGTILFTPLNFGIDMTGGMQLEYTYEGAEANIETLRTQVENFRNTFNSSHENVFSSIQVYKITGEQKIGITVGVNQQKLSDAQIDTFKSEFKTQIFPLLTTQNSTFSESLFINVGESFGAYIRNTAYLTLFIAIVGIGVYVAFAFSGFAGGISSLSFGLITILTLFHDVLIAAGLYIFVSIFFKEYQIDTFFITALLTILGYSINDTIVVFDRIRANLIKHVKKGKINLENVIIESIEQTFVRSIYTSLTLFIVLVAIFFLGPEAISGFILVMIFGTIVGTYSSIFIASPILYDFNKNKEIRMVEKKKNSPEDKMVV